MKINSAAFIKRNPIPGGNSLLCEKRGLEELRLYRERHGLNIPEVLDCDTSELTLEKIDARNPNGDDWKNLGRGVALLHKVSAPKFGFSEPNFIGLNRQENGWHENWGEFFTEHRLEYQISLVADTGIKKDLEARMASCRANVARYLNLHNPVPSLLHGDLWAGNVLFSDRGPWLIDPAVYYGDREADLAMSEMFGGFHGEFYVEYDREFPIAGGYEKRKRIYNLYHYLNHYNLFGDSYFDGVEHGMSALDRV